jgi:parallel beta-helix repeat protein
MSRSIHATPVLLALIAAACGGTSGNQAMGLSDGGAARGSGSDSASVSGGDSASGPGANSSYGDGGPLDAASDVASPSSSAPDGSSDASSPGPKLQKPGPSPDLFASPFYACVRNFYVAMMGSDSADGSQAHPWLTLQHADDSAPLTGDCINVEPGTYAAGVTLSHGGNLAAATGYVVYRCTALDACKITDPGAAFAIETSTFPMPSYFVIDGFELVASSAETYGQGVKVWDGDESGTGAKNSSHHVWVLNNVIHGYGQTGVQMNDGEFFYTIHNTIYDNARVTCDAQGSGISYVVLKAFGGYQATADDTTNPSPLIGSLSTGSSFFHNAVEWNVVYNNALTQCGTAGNDYDTDGNNIIMDTLSNGGSTGVPYPDSTLVAFNVVYDSGGGGVHIFNSEYVTVANNTCFNSYLDPYNSGSARACIDSTGSYGDTFINNVAVAIPASHSSCAYNTPPYAMWNDAFLGSPASSSATPDTFSNNISEILGATSCQGEVSMSNGDSYSCTRNKCKTNPAWVDVGATSAGTETTPPAGANFALAVGSPAIGYGLTETYLPAQSVDVGACSHTFATCP